MANEQNLIPVTKRSQEEAKRISRLGGIASGEVRRARKTLKQDLKLILDMQDKEGNTFQENMTKALIKQALKGNVKAYEVARDTIGEEQEERDRPIVYVPAKDIGEAFVRINRQIDNRTYNDIWFEGGRGSTKSSYAHEKMVEILQNDPKKCGLCTRKVGNTLKDSTYANIKWAVEMLGDVYPSVLDEWEFTKSPLEARNKVTGQMIFFRGADDPGKIKSIKVPKGMYIGVELNEEFDQMAGMEEVRKIDQSVVRGGDDILKFRIYNTPISLMHFVNKEKKIPKKGRIIHKSDYRSVDEEWLGKPFIEEAEHLKEVNPKAYEHEYLGNAVGIGGVVFENVTLREITDEEIEANEWQYQGIDWGYHPDPFHFGKMYYNSSKRILGIFQEIRFNKKGNQAASDELIEKGVDISILTTADSSEPKSIGDFKSYGWSIRGANKGSERGKRYTHEMIKWLQSLTEIVIDPVRCPYTAKEFTEYEYMKDKEGNDISEFPDKDNHGIDMTGYAMQPVWRIKGE